MNNEDIYFVPLGGVGEIGMNMSLYGFRDRWIMIDMGITFGDDTLPGIDVLTPDPKFVMELGDRLEGLILTHSHEDHLGAIPYLWPRIRCPVYGTPFACELVRRKTEGDRRFRRMTLNEIPVGGEVELGPFRVDLIPAAHSVPEANILAIQTAAGTVVHATDWKIDPDPLVGRRTDEETLRALGDRGVLALVCDSTNALVEGTAGSEAALRENMIGIIEKCPGRVVVASFASNVARMETINRAALATGRHASLIGRSLWRILEISQRCGYLKDIEPFLPEKDVGYLPPEKILAGVTGSQGEPRSALTRIARGDSQVLSLEPGDTAIFSSREIPGNELAIGRVQNQLAHLGVDIITDDTDPVHVSGHPARDELRLMYDWLRPRFLIPIHGERRHLQAQVALARKCGVSETAVIENGTMIRITGDGIETARRVETGRLAVDGNRLVPLEGTIVRDRNRLRHNGIAVATVVLDRGGRLVGDPQLSVPGVLDDGDDDEIWEDALDQMIANLERLPGSGKKSDDVICDTVRKTLRRFLYDRVGKRPFTEVHVVRI